MPPLRRTVTTFLVSALIASVRPEPQVRPVWDPATLPVAFHSSNSTGRWSAAQLQQLAKYAMVTVEKWQNIVNIVPATTLVPAYNTPGGLYSCQNGSDLSRCGCCQEDEMVASLAGLKRVNPKVVTIAYLHSDIMHSWYRAAGRLAQAPECWLRDQAGEIVHSIHGNGGGNSGKASWMIYDHTQPKCSSLWADSCLELTRTGVFDACFVDGCSDKPPSILSPSQAAAFVRGKQKMLTELQGNVSGPLICGSTGDVQLDMRAVQAEGWGVAPHGSTMFATREIPNLMSAMRAGILFQAHGRAVCEHEADPHHPAVQTELAAFLIGMDSQAYFVCGSWELCSADPPLRPERCAPNPNSTSIPWLPVYDLPLGAPVANATKTGGVWHRQFASGTTVTFDTKHEKGRIFWGSTANAATLET
jgi:hypothetical protein